MDGTARTFSDANGKAVYPLLYNGSIYLHPAIGQLMGRTVSWNGTSSTVTLTGEAKAFIAHASYTPAYAPGR